MQIDQERHDGGGADVDSDAKGWRALFDIAERSGGGGDLQMEIGDDFVFTPQEGLVGNRDVKVDAAGAMFTRANGGRAVDWGCGMNVLDASAFEFDMASLAKTVRIASRVERQAFGREEITEAARLLAGDELKFFTPVRGVNSDIWVSGWSCHGINVYGLKAKLPLFEPWGQCKNMIMK